MNGWSASELKQCHIDDAAHNLTLLCNAARDYSYGGRNKHLAKNRMNEILKRIKKSIRAARKIAVSE